MLHFKISDDGVGGGISVLLSAAAAKSRVMLSE
jgi:hypothetical protein